MEAVKAKIESLKKDVGDKEDQIDALEQKLREERAVSQKNEDEMRSLQRQNQLLEEELDKERERARSAQDGYKDAELQKDQQAEEMKSLQNQINTLEGEVDKLTADKLEMKAKLDEQNQQLHELLG